MRLRCEVESRGLYSEVGRLLRRLGLPGTVSACRAFRGMVLFINCDLVCVSVGDWGAISVAESEVLRFDDLNPHLLLKNGNFLYKVPYKDGFAVVKVYYGSRGAVSRLWKSFENVVVAGQTSYMPKTRLRIERECIDLWRKHGFRVFDVYDNVKVEAPQAPAGGYMVLEFVERPKLGSYLADSSVPEDERFALYQRWLPEWSRRHDIALAEREPRLVHENGDGKHVMLMEDESFLWFDFEMVFRSRGRVEEYVAREIAQYMWQILRTIPPELHERFYDETITGYPVRDRLERTYDYYFNSPNLFHRFGRSLDRRFRRRKNSSKYNVTSRLREKLLAGQAG